MPKPRIFAVAGWRYEPEWLVDELRENLAWVDELVIVDDRARTGELWVHEGKYRKMQRAALIEAGIKPWDWVLVTSPDERWERSAGRVIRRLIQRRTRTIFSFPLKEMWTRCHYRVDGQWGAKWRPRLYPFLPNQRFTSQKIQTSPTPLGRSYRRRRVSTVTLYHLENVLPFSRAERAIVYEALSPGSQRRAAASRRWRRHDRSGKYMRRYGFAYLADPRGAVLRPVPRGRGFVPAVTEPYRFEVPEELLVKESGKTRAQWMAWLTSTLGLSAAEVLRR